MKAVATALRGRFSVSIAMMPAMAAATVMTASGVETVPAVVATMESVVAAVAAMMPV